MLDISHNIFWVHLVIDQSLNQKLCVGYFTKFLWGIFGAAP